LNNNKATNKLIALTIAITLVATVATFSYADMNVDAKKKSKSSGCSNPLSTCGQTQTNNGIYTKILYK
jgi:hypothetical protein